MLHFMNTASVTAPLQHWTNKHPCLLCALLMVGAPLGILLAVMLITYGIMIPVSFLMGWL